MLDGGSNGEEAGGWEGGFATLVGISWMKSGTYILSAICL